MKLAHTRLEEYRLKVIDVRNRLVESKSFIAVVKQDKKLLVFYGGNGSYQPIRHHRFITFLGGFSRAEVSEVSSLISSRESSFESELSKNDFGAAVAAEIFSKYAQMISEDLDIPESVACEVLFVDSEDYLVFVDCFGRESRVEFEEISKPMIWGHASSEMKKAITKNIADFIASGRSGKSVTRSFCMKLKEMAGVSFVGFNSIDI